MKTKWLYIILIVVAFTALACGVQPEEAIEATVAPPATPVAVASEAEQAVDSEEMLLWEGSALFAEDPTECHRLVVNKANQAVFGPCDGEQTEVEFVTTGPDGLAAMIARFAPFQTETPQGQINFKGQGEIGGAAWERAITTWASFTYAELATGHVGAANRTVLAWNVGEQAGQPEQCKMLIVLAHGYATASLAPCQGGQMNVLASDWVDSAAWEQFDTWLYGNAPTYQGNNYLDGRGTAEMSEADIEALAAWAKTVYEEISSTAAVSDATEDLAAVTDEPALFRISDEQGKWGLIDQTGQVVVKPQYDYLEHYVEGRISVQRGNQWGFLDETGQVVVEPHYEGAFSFAEGRASVQQGVKWGVIDRAGQMVVEPQYDSIGPFREGLARVDTFGQWGVIDTRGQIVVEPQFRSIESFRGGRAVVFSDTGVGYVDDQGRVIIRPNYAQAGSFPAEADSTPMLAPVLVDDQWGYIDGSGQIAIEPQFSYATAFAEGLAIVNVSPDQPKFGYINANGQQVIEAKFDIADDFSEGLAMVKQGETLGYINPSGQMVITLTASEAHRFSEGRAVIVTYEEGALHYGYIDASGHVIIEPQFDEAQPFSEGLAGVGFRQDDSRLTYGYMDLNGQMVIEPQFDYAGPFVDGLAQVVVEGRTGYINPMGEMVIKPQFDSGREFSDGLAPVDVDGLWGYIDTTGEWVVAPQFGMALAFVNGRASVVTVGQSAYIDRTGRVVLKGPGLYGSDFREGLAWFNDGTGYGYIDPSGAVVIEPQFVGLATEVVFSQRRPVMNDPG